MLIGKTKIARADCVRGSDMRVALLLVRRLQEILDEQVQVAVSGLHEDVASTSAQTRWRPRLAMTKHVRARSGLPNRSSRCRLFRLRFVRFSAWEGWDD